jgi:ankyrin repeat protein
MLSNNAFSVSLSPEVTIDDAVCKPLTLDVNSYDSEGWTPIHYAASEDHAETVQLLLQQGADPSLGHHGGANAALVAAALGHPATLQALVQSLGVANMAELCSHRNAEKMNVWDTIPSLPEHVRSQVVDALATIPR